ncbi:hypothetical protein QVD17_16881 [Tagetes erecta]|uniref:Uncharacterized protein n=1 Tax=Tagetes erecta TaxID=13708 RepID=A0AAD8KRE6_TARER|nr:hypothetical protein QVD17_16881 [Tagetes erecta]
MFSPPRLYKLSLRFHWIQVVHLGFAELHLITTLLHMQQFLKSLIYRSHVDGKNYVVKGPGAKVNFLRSTIKSTRR